MDKSKVHASSITGMDTTNLNRNGGRKSNFVKKKDETFLLMSCHMNEKNQQDLWYLRTGYRKHMSQDK